MNRNEESKFFFNGRKQKILNNKDSNSRHVFQKIMKLHITGFISFCIICFLQPASEFVFYKARKMIFCESNYTFDYHFSSSIILKKKNSPKMLYKSHDIMGQTHVITKFINFYDMQCSHGTMGSRTNKG